MSEVKYGSVELKLVKTNSISQTPVYTEDGIDYLYTRFSCDFVCVFNPDLNGFASQAAAMVSIRRTLESPRLSLLVTIDGSPLIQVDAPDVAAGPFPRNVLIREILGSKLLMVQFQIDAHRQDCSNEFREIISNRFKIESRYDENCYCTRTVSGKVVVNGKGNINPDSDEIRNFVFPPLPKGWKRMNFTFQPSMSGLELSYAVIDQEQMTVPPPPATKAQGTYRQYSGHLGVSIFAKVDITLTGPKTAEVDGQDVNVKTKLIELAAAIALSRFSFDAQGDEKDILYNASVGESLWANEVTISITARRAFANKMNFKPLIETTKLATEIPGTESNEAHLCGPEGTSLIQNLLAAWHFPCEAADRATAFGDQPETAFISPGQDPDVQILPPSNELQQQSLGDPDWTSEHRQDQYGDAEMDVSYETDQHVLHLAIAGSSSDLVSESPGEATPSAVNVQVARPTTRKKLKYRAERYGQWPQTPLAAAEIQDGKLIEKMVTPETPHLSQDGETYLSAMRMEATYGMETLIEEDKTALDAGKLPYYGSEVEDRKVPTDKFVTNLFDAGTVEGG